ncbi:MAG: hypothetical protein HWD92_13735 [Flavobacteriia bacterium]|nr:hypothetical protein [Flavobacteriia bacterium]
MRKNLQITFLWLAGLFLLTHSFVPHVHHDSPVEHTECHDDEDRGIIDFLADVFHSDVEVETLAHFQISKIQITAPTIPVLEATLILPPVLEADYTTIPSTPAFILSDEPLVEGLSLRGPPLV